MGRLHTNWVRSGGKSKLLEDQPLGDWLAAMVRGDPLVEGGTSMVSPFFGDIDPSRLNLGLSAFSGGIGQIQFLAALAVVTGRFDILLKKMPATLKAVGGDVRQSGWKQLPIDWRRGNVILRGGKGVFQTGLESYKQFSREYADGDMLKAYKLASALLTKQEFQGLGWGKQILLKVSEVEKCESTLREGLEKGNWKGREGWLAYFRKTEKTNPQSVWVTASALLGTSFSQLEWPTKREAVRLMS